MRLPFDFNLVGAPPIVIINNIVGFLFTLAYFYQFVYVIKSLRRGEVQLPKAKKKHCYAYFIAAHNEEAVIGNLVRSILTQDYPRECLDCFVVADACTDATAEKAREAGAIVYERNDLARKGKSWVMDYGFDRILNEYGDKYEAFIVMDADNIISPGYTDIMNDVFDAGYLVSTSYRNSKNFDSSWVSAGSALWYLREARFLNNVRMMNGTSCAISGSGWMVSSKIVRGMHGWDFHTLTEDIQFSTFCSIHNIQIGYAPAEFFDEQPVTFKASWVQRMRWTKGFYQIFFSYWQDLIRGVRNRRFSAYDMLMTIAPGILLTLVSVFANLSYFAIGVLSHGYMATTVELRMAMWSLLMMFVGMYFTLFFMGLVTTITERKHIHSKPLRVFTNLFTFPIFILSYIPIGVVAFFKKVEWVPTKHDIVVNFDDVVGAGATSQE